MRWQNYLIMEYVLTYEPTQQGLHDKQVACVM